MNDATLTSLLPPTTLRGRAHVVGDDVDTDQIIAARHLVTTDPGELGEHLLESTAPGLVDLVAPGDVLVAGRNFGCGSSREHAPLAILGAGFRCVVAHSFARIFFRNAINIGLLPLECPAAVTAARPGHDLEIDRDTGAIRNVSLGRTYDAARLPDFVQGIVDAGGLVAWTRAALHGEDDR